MATVKVGKSAPKSVPAPQAPSFVLGSRPAVVRAPPIERIKPSKLPGARDYGKVPPLGGDTGMSGMS